MSGTLAEKVWADHVVVHGEDGAPDLLYIDLHLVHEVTSPQAFDGLRMAGRKVRRPDLTIATEDHNTPTVNIDRRYHQPHADRYSAQKCEGIWYPFALPGGRRSGNRPRRWPSAWTDSTRHDYRLR